MDAALLLSHLYKGALVVQRDFDQVGRFCAIASYGGSCDAMKFLGTVTHTHSSMCSNWCLSLLSVAIGLRYEYGDYDFAKAFEWFERASLCGSPAATLYLGNKMILCHYPTHCAIYVS
jgi:hypothetical protein